MLGQAERRGRCRLDAAEERRHHTTEAVGSRRQHQVPAERVDRGATGDGGTVEDGVHHREFRHVGGDCQHDGDRLDVLEQIVVLVGGDLGGLDVVDDVERVAPRRRGLQILVPDRLHQHRQLAPDQWICHDGNSPWLAVAAGRSEPRIVEHARDRGIVDGFVGERPHRPVGADRLANLHVPNGTCHASGLPPGVIVSWRRRPSGARC